jgi:hypothetical protein
VFEVEVYHVFQHLGNFHLESVHNVNGSAYRVCLAVLHRYLQTFPYGIHQRDPLHYISYNVPHLLDARWRQHKVSTIVLKMMTSNQVRDRL